MGIAIDRARNFCERFKVETPILLAPMAGASAPSLSSAVANAGGMGAAGMLLMSPDEIKTWMTDFRKLSEGPVQLNVWIPDPAPERNADKEAVLRDYLGHWGPSVPADAADVGLHSFAAQCEAILETEPAVISSVMGLYPPEFVARMKAKNIWWFATVSTVAEALQAQQAGADAIVAQGAEAGGHRAAFAAKDAERAMVGLVSLIPSVVDAVDLPVIATGGIADARGVAAALALGASAVQIGTALLRSPEAKTHPAWAAALATTRPEDTMITRAFSGRPGRAIGTEYVRSFLNPDAPSPAPYPIQRALTAAMRAAGAKNNDVHRMQVWCGQSAALGSSQPAAELVKSAWSGAQAILS